MGDGERGLRLKKLAAILISTLLSMSLLPVIPAQVAYAAEADVPPVEVGEEGESAGSDDGFGSQGGSSTGSSSGSSSGPSSGSNETGDSGTTPETQPEPAPSPNPEPEPEPEPATHQVVVNKSSITKVSVSSSAVSVWMRKASSVSGYQVCYSTSSSFSSCKSVSTSSTYLRIKGLSSKRKYYVKVRCYKVVDGVKYYSGWSQRKTVTTAAKKKAKKGKAYLTASKVKKYLKKQIGKRGGGHKYYGWGYHRDSSVDADVLDTSLDAFGMSLNLNTHAYAGSKRVDVSWSKSRNVTGYQVCVTQGGKKKYSYAKAASATSKTITGLKAGSCGVKVRPYVKSKGKYVYGSWSYADSVTVV